MQAPLAPRLGPPVRRTVPGPAQRALPVRTLFSGDARLAASFLPGP